MIISFDKDEKEQNIMNNAIKRIEDMNN